MKFFAALFVLFGFTAQSMATPYTSCSNGAIENVGDAHYQINLYEDGVEFLPYEGSFSFDFTDVTYDKGTFTIVNKTTEISSEGETSKITVNAMLTLNSSRTELNAAVSENNGPFRSFTMSCSQK